MKWQLRAERRVRANIGSSLQLKHHRKNQLSLSVTFFCDITNLTILENAGTENGSSVSNFNSQFWVSVNTAGLEMRIDSLTIKAVWWVMVAKADSGLGEEGGWYAVLSLSMQNSHENRSGTTKAVRQQRNQRYLQYLSCWTALVRGKGWFSRGNEFTFPIFAFTES